MDYLVQIQVNFPPEMPTEQRADVLAREAERGRELRADGIIVRIWRIPGRQANVAIWNAETPDILHQAIISLPAFPWVDAHVTALATHPLDAVDTLRPG